MPKYDYFPITNQTLGLGHKTLYFYVFHQFPTRTGLWCENFALSAVSSAKSRSEQLKWECGVKFRIACGCSEKSHGYNVKCSKIGLAPPFSCAIIPSWFQLD